MEKEAIEKIVNLLPSEAQRDEVMSLYLEYENKSTPEAWLVFTGSHFDSFFGRVNDIDSMTTFNGVFLKRQGIYYIACNH